jgi:hypothetical protein
VPQNVDCVEELFLSALERKKQLMLPDTEIKTAQTAVPEFSAFEFEISIEKHNDTNHLVLINSQHN